MEILSIPSTCHHSALGEFCIGQNNDYHSRIKSKSVLKRINQGMCWVSFTYLVTMVNALFKQRRIIVVLVFLKIHAASIFQSNTDSALDNLEPFTATYSTKSRDQSSTQLDRFCSENAILYLDIGSRLGGSTRWIRNYFNVSSERVLGLDIDEENVKICNRGGGRCRKQDVSKLNIEATRPIVTGVTLFHVIEHIGTPLQRHPIPLPWTWLVFRNASHIGPVKYPRYELTPPVGTQVASTESIFNTEVTTAATNVFLGSARLARSFLLFRGPCFDGEDALHEIGFVRSFAAWKLHTCHFNSSHIVDSWLKLRRKGTMITYVHNPILNSDNERIFPVIGNHEIDSELCSDALCDQHIYNYGKHTSKPVPPLQLFERPGRPFHLFMSAIFLFEDAGKLSAPSIKALLNVERVMTKKRGMYASCSPWGSDKIHFSDATCQELLEPLFSNIRGLESRVVP